MWVGELGDVGLVASRLVQRGIAPGSHQKLKTTEPMTVEEARRFVNAIREHLQCVNGHPSLPGRVVAVARMKADLNRPQAGPPARWAAPGTAATDLGDQQLDRWRVRTGGAATGRSGTGGAAHEIGPVLAERD
jgi:hypothetical protein